MAIVDKAQELRQKIINHRTDRDLRINDLAEKYYGFTLAVIEDIANEQDISECGAILTFSNMNKYFSFNTTPDILTCYYKKAKEYLNANGNPDFDFDIDAFKKMKEKFEPTEGFDVSIDEKETSDGIGEKSNYWEITIIMTTKEAESSEISES